MGCEMYWQLGQVEFGGNCSLEKIAYRRVIGHVMLILWVPHSVVCLLGSFGGFRFERWFALISMYNVVQLESSSYDLCRGRTRIPGSVGSNGSRTNVYIRSICAEVQVPGGTMHDSQVGSLLKSPK